MDIMGENLAKPESYFSEKDKDHKSGFPAFAALGFRNPFESKRKAENVRHNWKTFV